MSVNERGATLTREQIDIEDKLYGRADSDITLQPSPMTRELLRHLQFTEAAKLLGEAGMGVIEFHDSDFEHGLVSLQKYKSFLRGKRQWWEVKSYDDFIAKLEMLDIWYELPSWFGTVVEDVWRGLLSGLLDAKKLGRDVEGNVTDDLEQVVAWADFSGWRYYSLGLAPERPEY